MHKTMVVLLLTLAVTAGAAAPAKKSKTPPKPVTHAPAEVTHAMAFFLRDLSKNGAHTVTFKATAHGTRFFFEEPSGVTVYRFVNGQYVREEFLRGVRLQRAVDRYTTKKKTK